MPNRILFLVSAMLTSLALSALPTLAQADDCLTSPGKGASAGGHWRYHVERGSGRKCWYLTGAASKDDAATAATADADADGRNVDTTGSVPPKPAAKIAPSLEAAASSPPERPRAAKPVPTPSPPAALGPANNARAEFIDTPRDAQQAASPQPDAAQAAVPDGNAPAATNAAPSPSAQPAVVVQPAADQPAQAGPADQAAPPTPSADADEGPDYLLYALIFFTAAFASVVGFAGLRFLLEWWRDWREETRWRQSEQTYAGYRERSMTAMDEVPMGLVPEGDASMPRTSAQRPFEPEEPPHRLEDEIDHIEQLLALTREAAPDTKPSMFAEAHAPRDAAE